MTRNEPTEADWLEGNDPQTQRARFEEGGARMTENPTAAGLSEAEVNDLYPRWLQKVSFTHLTSAVERILSARAAVAEDHIAIAEDRVDVLNDLLLRAEYRAEDAEERLGNMVWALPDPDDAYQRGRADLAADVEALGIVDDDLRAVLAARKPTTGHDCATCPDCIHDGHKCCGCYDGACCQPTIASEDADETCDECGHAKSVHRDDGCYFSGSKASCRCTFGGGR